MVLKRPGRPGKIWVEMSMLRRIRAGLTGLFLLVATVAQAAVFNGTIESFSADERSITIKLTGKKDETRTFTIIATPTLLLDGKKATLEQITDGQSVILVTNSNDQAIKLTLRNPKPAAAPVTKPADPPEPPTRPAARKPDRSEETSAAAWPQYRGPNRDNISKETGLLNRWPDSGPPLEWTQRGLGEGYSTVSIAEGKIFTMGTDGDTEVVLAMDADTGKPLWSAKTGGGLFRDGTGNGPRGTPTIDQDRVYALGANGDLVCLGVDNGEVVWSKNILREFGGNNITWGISESVLIDGKQLFCFPGGRQASVVSLDKLTGRVLWRASIDGAPSASYASPILVEHGGDKVLVNYVHTGVVGIRANNGAVLWGYPASANGTANCSAPLFEDGMVFTASGYGTGCAMFRLGAGGRATVGYTNREMQNHHGGMVLLDGHVYGFDEAILKCVNLKSGRTVWQNRSVGKGALTCADGLLFLRGENGTVGLCKATPEGYEELGRFDPENRSNKPAWAHPVVCGGRLYLRDMDSLAAYRVKK